MKLQNCSFTGITHISEKISRCRLQTRKMQYSLHIMHYDNSNNNVKNNHFKHTKKLTTINTILRCTPYMFPLILRYGKKKRKPHQERHGLCILVPKQTYVDIFIMLSCRYNKGPQNNTHPTPTNANFILKILSFQGHSLLFFFLLKGKFVGTR